MNRTVLILALLLSLVLLTGSSRRSIMMAKVAVPSVSYLVSEDAEGTGTPSGWTDGSGPDWDYTTTVLEGAQSFKTASAGMSSLISFTAGSERWFYCLFRTANLNDQYAVRLRDGSNFQLAAVRTLADGTVRVYSGTTDFSATAAGFVSANTTYSVWLQYVKGTGANSVARCYVSTTTTLPSVSAEFTTGSETTDCAQLYLQPNQADICIWDHIRVSATSIGSTPP